MGFTVYILYSSKTNKYYIGHTSDINDRLLRHNSGRSIATKAGVPWVVMYTESYPTKSEAYKREMKIKSWKSRVLIEELIRKQSSASSAHSDLS